jgi:hypothetical protein
MNVIWAGFWNQADSRREQISVYAEKMPIDGKQAQNTHEAALHPTKTIIRRKKYVP